MATLNSLRVFRFAFERAGQITLVQLDDWHIFTRIHQLLLSPNFSDGKEAFVVAVDALGDDVFHVMYHAKTGLRASLSIRFDKLCWEFRKRFAEESVTDPVLWCTLGRMEGMCSMLGKSALGHRPGVWLLQREAIDSFGHRWLIEGLDMARDPDDFRPAKMSKGAFFQRVFLFEELGLVECDREGRKVLLLRLTRYGRVLLESSRPPLLL